MKDNLRYSLRSQNKFLRSSANTSQYGLNYLRMFISKVWSMVVPTEIKKRKTLNIFKKNIKKWEPKNCKCKLCLSYIQNIGYLNVN